MSNGSNSTILFNHEKNHMCKALKIMFSQSNIK